MSITAAKVRAPLMRLCVAPVVPGLAPLLLALPAQPRFPGSSTRPKVFDGPLRQGASPDQRDALQPAETAAPQLKLHVVVAKAKSPNDDRPLLRFRQEALSHLRF
jgi:hypothetical protein